VEFPNLLKLLRYLAMDNGMWLHHEITWPENSSELEALASKLNPNDVDNPVEYVSDYEYVDEFELLSSGEESDIETLVDSKGLKDLNDFLGEAFQGKLYSTFFYEPVVW
jgi:hypothetical protein